MIVCLKYQTCTESSFEWALNAEKEKAGETKKMSLWSEGVRDSKRTFTMTSLIQKIGHTSIRSKFQLDEIWRKAFLIF